MEDRRESLKERWEKLIKKNKKKVRWMICKNGKCCQRHNISDRNIEKKSRRVAKMEESVKVYGEIDPLIRVIKFANNEIKE